jgi:hypothetical protein
MRLAVLRVKDARTLVVKEPASPVVLLLRVDDLSPAQLRCLCVATPFAPVMADGEIGPWSPGAQAFEGAIASVEMASRGAPAMASRRGRASLVKRQRGGGVVELH